MKTLLLLCFFSLSSVADILPRTNLREGSLFIQVTQLKGGEWVKFEKCFYRGGICVPLGRKEGYDKQELIKQRVVETLEYRLASFAGLGIGFGSYRPAKKAVNRLLPARENAGKIRRWTRRGLPLVLSSIAYYTATSFRPLNADLQKAQRDMLGHNILSPIDFYVDDIYIALDLLETVLSKVDQPKWYENEIKRIRNHPELYRR